MLQQFSKSLGFFGSPVVIILINCRGDSKLKPPWKIYIYIYIYYIILILKILWFFTLKKFCDQLNFFFFTIFLKPNTIQLWTKFGDKLGCKLRPQFHSIYFFYWMQILKNLPLDYIFFLYPPYLQNFKKNQNQWLYHQSNI